MPQFDDRTIDDKLATARRREEERLLAALAEKHGGQYIDLHGVTIDVEALGLLDETRAREAKVAIFARHRDTVSLAARNPESEIAAQVVAELKERHLDATLFLASDASLEHAWERYADVRAAEEVEAGTLEIDAARIEQTADERATITQIAENIQTLSAGTRTREASEALEIILGNAIAVDASDVHIEPEQNAVRLRLRLDGVLTDITDISTELYTLIASRLKILSGLKLNVGNVAQDGRFSIRWKGGELDIRSSVIPGAFGDSIVMRLLDPHAALRSVDELGLNKQLRAVIDKEIRRPNGMILTTGPTGSGKTTSLYAMLRYIHTPEIKIVTLEDPIEYRLEGIIQTQVTKDYTFAGGLRSILRQDPDVILVGEIRDRDVAETAVHAAQTGHLVFSTLHTNSAAAAFARLIDLGVDPKMIESSVNLVLSERLVRTLCPECKEGHAPTQEERAQLETMFGPTPHDPIDSETLIYDARSCTACNGTGFQGRIGIFEGIRVDQAVSDIVLSDTREATIRKTAAPQGIPTMAADGALKILSGTTSLAEVLRVVDLADIEENVA